MLTVALSNTSCCPHRPESGRQTSEVTEQMSATLQSESQSEEQHAATLTVERLDTRSTETEIEIYDTTQPSDSATGRPPVRARIRQRHSEKGTEESRATETVQSSATAETESATSGQVRKLDKMSVVSSRPAGLRERLGQGAAWAAAVIILAAAGWMVYKHKKQNTV